MTFEAQAEYKASVAEFRYAQFCPLTRAVEILGERWTVLLLRELFLGPRRFRDLMTAMNGVSTSVLAERLARLEERRIVARRELPPPAAATVYELDEAGRALEPVLVELTRWGLRFLDSPGPGDCIRADWLLLGLTVFASRKAGPDLAARLDVLDGSETVSIHVRRGPDGTLVSRTPFPVDVVVRAPAMQMLMFTSGMLPPSGGGDGSGLAVEGDTEVAARIPALFEFRPTPAPPRATQDPSNPSNPQQGAER